MCVELLFWEKCVGMTKFLVWLLQIDDVDKLLMGYLYDDIQCIYIKKMLGRVQKRAIMQSFIDIINN